jgi:hypothetical protein
MLKEKN